MSVLSRGETWDQRSPIATVNARSNVHRFGSALWSNWEIPVFVDTDCWNLLQEEWGVLSNGVIANCLQLSESQMSNHVQWILPLGEIKCESVYRDCLIKLLLYVLSSLTMKSFQEVRTQSRIASLLYPEKFSDSWTRHRRCIWWSFVPHRTGTNERYYNYAMCSGSDWNHHQHTR